ncbi:Uncharacterised protein [Vibrio cholerae]|nr:Uncharacterised protein [Vibrio cholerae]
MVSFWIIVSCALLMGGFSLLGRRWHKAIIGKGS